MKIHVQNSQVRTVGFLNYISFGFFVVSIAFRS